MSTWRLSIGPSETLENVIAATGAATASKPIELTVDLAATVTDSNSPVSPRPVKRGEVLVALEILKQQVLRDNTFFQ
jgi:hypothetical protein